MTLWFARFFFFIGFIIIHLGAALLGEGMVVVLLGLDFFFMTLLILAQLP